MKNMSVSTKALLIGLVGTILGTVIPIISFPCFILLVGSLIVKASHLFDKKLAEKGRTYFNSFKLIVVIGYLLTVAISFLVLGFIAEWDFRVEHVIGILILCMIWAIIYTWLYFLPYLIANKKGHRQTHAIYILNIFAGWTIIAWVIALIWAYTEASERTVIEQKSVVSGADELKKYKELLDQQIITEKEFEEKKKQILGININD
jgi:hypothetical protein